MSDVKRYTGGCHCKAVRIQVDLDLTQPISRCNCTMCTMTSMANIIVKPAAFELVAGKDALTEYRRPQNPNSFPFCRTCGIHVFGKGNLPELGGDYVAVNALCLDDFDPSRAAFQYWDGRHNNWQAGSRDKPWPV